MPDKQPNPAAESPCCGFCKLDASGTYCAGCFRSRAEIGAWSRASDAEKISINENARTRAKTISATLAEKKKTVA